MRKNKKEKEKEKEERGKRKEERERAVVMYVTTTGQRRFEDLGLGSMFNGIYTNTPCITVDGGVDTRTVPKKPLPSYDELAGPEGHQLGLGWNEYSFIVGLIAIITFSLQELFTD